MIYEFQATQDLHGWEKPWAPGDGANIYDGEYEDGYYDIVDGSAASSLSWKRSKNPIPCQASTEYRFIFNKQASAGSLGYLLFYDDSDNYLSSNAQITSSAYGDGLVFTTPENCAFIKFYSNPNWFTQATACIELSTETGFSPYANICPPEGFNIWDPYNDEFIQVYAGYVNTNSRELYLRPVYQEYAGEELVGPWMSSMDEYAEDTTPTEGAFVIDFGGELTSFEITPFMLQTLLDSLGIRQHFTDGAGLLNSLMDQAQGRVRSEEELLHLSRPLNVIAIGDQLPAGLTFKPISKDVLPGLPGKFIR